MFFKSSESYIMNSCEVLEVFYSIRTDLDKLNETTNIIKIILDVTTENQNTYRILQLLLNTLYMICQTDKDLGLIASVFKLRLLSIIGFYPKINECATCKNKKDIEYFSIKDNGFKCTNCGKTDKSAISILPETVDGIRYTILSDPKKLFSFNISKDGEKELEIVSKIYLNEKLEKEYK